MTEKHIQALIALASLKPREFVRYDGQYLTIGETVLKVDLTPLFERGYVNGTVFITPSGLEILRSIGE